MLDGLLLQASMPHIPLASNSVHCILTSIPYWSLRSYDVPIQVWDGDPACKHTWKKFTRKGQSGGKASKKVQTKGEENFQIVRDTEQATCAKCGAWRGYYGLEPRLEQYIEHTVQVFHECRRVLRDDGTLWLNIGDTYSGSGGPGNQRDKSNKSGFTKFDNPNQDVENIGPSNALMIPQRIALALQADGWILRSEIIWAKGVSFCPTWSGSVMPESLDGWRWERHRIKIGESPQFTTKFLQGDARRGVNHDHKEPVWKECPGCEKCIPNDGYILRKGSWRPTKGHEYIYLFSKTNEYYCDREAVAEKASTQTHSKGNNTHKKDGVQGEVRANLSFQSSIPDRMSKRNLRSVWTLSPESYGGDHFATFGLGLVSPMIKAATSEKGVCPHCGSPWARVVKRKSGKDTVSTETLGWRPTCECPIQDPIPAIVADFFMGSGSTGKAASSLGRRWIGSDLSWNYLLQARENTLLKSMVEWEQGIQDKSDITDLPLFGGL